MTFLIRRLWVAGCGIWMARFTRHEKLRETASNFYLRSKPILISKLFLGILLVIIVLFAVPQMTLAQCSMCRDATAGSAQQVRVGLRKAIPVLGIPAIGVFGGILLIAVRRNAEARTMNKVSAHQPGKLEQ